MLKLDERGSQPPHNLEAERSILAAILLDNDSINLALEKGLEGRDFYDSSNQKIFDAILVLSTNREPIDLVTLTNILRDRGYYEQIGGSSTLTDLFNDSFQIGNIGHYSNIVRIKALYRRAIQIGNTIASKAYEGGDEPEAFLDEMEQLVFSVSQSQRINSYRSIREVVLKNTQMIEEYYRNKTRIVGLQTGFTEFDNLTSGLRPGEFMILAARPAMGKTSLAISAVQNIAKMPNSVIKFFSLEMSAEELGLRLLSGTSGIKSANLKNGSLGDREWPKLLTAAENLSNYKLFIDDSTDLSIVDIRARCRRLLSFEKRIDLIVVDFLQLLKGSKASQKEGTREREISEISRGLKSLAKEFKVPVIGLSQINRGVESRDEKRPLLSDLRESGSLEQDADIVCFLYRDEVYNNDTPDKGIAELIISKHRSGPTGTVRLGWSPEHTLFYNLEKSNGYR